MWRRIRGGKLTVLAFLAILASSCSNGRNAVSPTAVQAVLVDQAEGKAALEAEVKANPEQKGFYPLIVGESRTYQTQTFEQRTWDDGRQEPGDTVSTTVTISVSCVSFQAGRQYFTEISKRSNLLVARWYSWEDREGLHRRYQLDSPPCGSGGIEPAVASTQTDPGYATSLILAYPLHTGASWPPDATQPELRAVVEGMDVVNVPAGRFVAWRVRMPKSDPTSTIDPVRSWYSRQGYIKSARTYQYSVAGSGPYPGYTVKGSYSEVLLSMTTAAE
jgi:hypothetical protein